MQYAHKHFDHIFMVIFCSNKHFICVANAQATLFILPLSIRSFRLAKWKRKGKDGGRKRGREAGKEVEGRERKREAEAG